jgi:hypothetical protein
MRQDSRNNSAAAERGIDPRAHINHRLSHSGDVGDKRNQQNRNEHCKHVPGNTLSRLTDPNDVQESIDSIVPMTGFKHDGYHRENTYDTKPLLATGEFLTT